MKKKIFGIADEHIKKILRESITKVLKEDESGNLVLDNPNNNIEVSFIERKDILELADIIWEMLVNSYENIGGLKTYKDKDNFLSIVRYAKIACENGEIIACAIYRRMGDSFKMVAIGCNQQENGKLGIQEIIKDDIAKIDYHFWAEVSGAIEYYFKKYNGFPMPNTLASEILKIPSDKIILSNKDMVHYEREIFHELFEKMIFGIPSEEVYQKALKEVEHYGNFIEEVNRIDEENRPQHLRYTLKQAVYIVENIYRAHVEDNFNELIPSWYEALKEAKKTFESCERTPMVRDYLEYCDYLFKHMTLFEIHPFDFK